MIPRDKDRGLSLAHIRRVLDYAPDTGIFTWKVQTNQMTAPGTRAGYRNPKTGYWLVCIAGKNYMLHRLAWFHRHGRWPHSRLDHINGDNSDNRLANLRECNAIESARNRGPWRNKKFKLPKGIEFHVSGKYRARIFVDGKHKHLGLFATIEGANTAYQAAAERTFGEFVRAE